MELISSSTILLTTLNARYAHSALGLRYLYANLHEFQNEAIIVEFTINEQIQTIAEDILKYAPKIIGISVYIWNAREVSRQRRGWPLGWVVSHTTLPL